MRRPRYLSAALIFGVLWTLNSFADSPKTIEWTDLMPEEDLRLLETMPTVDHGDLSDEELAEDPANQSLRPQDRDLAGEVENAIAQAMGDTASEGGRTWEDALVSTNTRPEFDNTEIRLPGFIVPLEFDDEMNIREFFLVPYYGACIHVPPPPPNQIIFVSYPEGFQLDALYTPFWVSGTLKLERTENDMALSVYSMDAAEIVEYTE
ncbi:MULTISPECIES: DUF3299 domain-containing protein [unclassified Marinimicrobium]|jgi:hypothetical protein|uniref:DUF3299 domain-containing protein n=1 Tax=unclassified Marinimicrobium TaxID=2632100 RepID=UPI000C3CED74|nr:MULTISPECIES: DUF3299 domain-containing protein [unclassified Marinimicrobium]MAN51425.1 hypothetical protein [Marinimicrobium sp.]